MQRFNLFLGSSLALLAAFVGRQAYDTHRHLQLMAKHAASYGNTPVERVAEDAGVASPRATAREGMPVANRREAADVRRRLEVSAEGTYIGDILAERDSALVRWPDRRTNPLRVWVQMAPGVADFNLNFVPLVRSAFNAWIIETGIPVSFTFVTDSTAADVRVTWLDRFRENISGKTLWARDEHFWIVDAQIQLAVHHRTGEALDTGAVRAIALHEVGHLLGLDHTRDTMAIMTPKVRVKELSASDRATAQLLYALPPGPVAIHTR